MTTDQQQYIDIKLNELFVHWLAQASRWGAMLFLSLSVLDYVSMPENFIPFIPYRIGISALLLGGASALTRLTRMPSRPVLFYRALAFLIILSCAATLEYMIVKTGGHRSPYYAGMILLGLCAIGFIPARPSFHIAVAVLIYGSYVLPLALIEKITDVRGFFAANVFLLSSLATIVFLRSVSQKSLVRELGLKYELERHQAGLEERAREQTAQLNATILDLKKLLADLGKTDQELKESEEKYRNLFGHANDAIYLLDPDTRKIVDCNMKAAAITGYSTEELKTMTIADLHPEQERFALPDRFKGVYSKGSSSGISGLHHQRKDGGLIDIEVNAGTVEIGGSRIILSIIRDVSERNRTETALRESEEKFRTLFEESKDVFYISTPQGKFLDINPAGFELFGYVSKEELLAVDITRDIYVYQQDRKKFVELVQRTGHARDYEVQMKRRSGERLTVLITSTALRDGSGNVTSFRGIIRDVTEHKKLESQLLQSQKMEAVGQLAGGIAHDFNNILTAITGYSGLLQKKLRDDDPLKMYVEHIRSAADQASSLTHSLLAFSRKQIMNPLPADLNEIVAKVKKLLIRLIGEDIELTTAFDAGDLPVVADSVQIEQVLMNLATNARDAMPRGGRLSISTGEQLMDNEAARRHRGMKPGRYALLIVADTGSGMDERTREKIFEPFFTTKEVGKGTGLGLAMVYGIIKQHDGYITASSAAGQGTTFTIYLPFAAKKDERTAPRPESASAEGGTETILLGEDNEDVRSMTRTMLEDFGYTVIEAADGSEVINQFLEHQGRIDLLILDVIMPKKNGREAYDAVRSIRPDVKVLFTSGYTADVMRTKGIREEGLHYVQKPVSMDTLLLTIRTILG